MAIGEDISLYDHLVANYSFNGEAPTVNLGFYSLNDYSCPGFFVFYHFRTTLLCLTKAWCRMQLILYLAGPRFVMRLQALK